eukprot:GHVQ01029565.1.p1 GENE.GHVQ01029565.1~~GHVQ01029565.1.p1  ORF type:complete len:369 (+),score=20.03 GHVQ01029565.1:815-1921(+)
MVDEVRYVNGFEKRTNYSARGDSGEMAMCSGRCGMFRRNHLFYNDCGTQNKHRRATIVEHKINTRQHPPFAETVRRYAQPMKEEILRQVKILVTMGAIEPSTSPWRAMPVKVEKPDNKGWRMCIDYRRLNQRKVKDAYPTASVEDFKNTLEGSSLFMTMDIEHGFHNIMIEEKDRLKTAFWTPRGLFHWRVMPFGLINAPATFARFVDAVLFGLDANGVRYFVDDILIGVSDWESAILILDEVLRRIAAAEICINLKKTKLCYDRAKAVGLIFDSEGIQINEEKLMSITKMCPPKDIQALPTFFGICKLFSRFLRELFRTNEAIHKPLVLRYPRRNGQWILGTDASDFAIGYILQQEIGCGVPRINVS